MVHSGSQTQKNFTKLIRNLRKRHQKFSQPCRPENFKECRFRGRQNINLLWASYYELGHGVYMSRAGPYKNGNISAVIWKYSICRLIKIFNILKYVV